MTASKSWAEGYLLNQFLAPRTNHRTDAGAAHREPHAPAGRDRARDPRERSARTSSSCTAFDARPGRGRQRRDEIVALPRSGGGRRDHHQHRHRLARSADPDHRHLGAARRVPRRPARLQARGRDSGRRVQPHQHAEARRDPRQRRRRPGVDGAARSGRSGFRRQGRRRPRRRNQHLHRLQPGLPRPRLRRQAASCLVNPRAGHETELVAEDAQRAAHRGGRRRPRRVGLRHRRRRTRPSCHAVRARPTSAASSTRPMGSGQRGVRRDAALFPAPAGLSTVSLQVGQRVATTLLAGATTRGRRDRRRPRMPAIRGIDHPKVVYPDALTGRAEVGRRSR